MDMAYRDYEKLKKETNRGRNTLYAAGVLCAYPPAGSGLTPV